MQAKYVIYISNYKRLNAFFKYVCAYQYFKKNTFSQITLCDGIGTLLCFPSVYPSIGHGADTFLVIHANIMLTVILSCGQRVQRNLELEEKCRRNIPLIMLNNLDNSLRKHFKFNYKNNVRK